MSDNKDQKNLEQKLEELESIVNQLEKESIDLEESIKLYQKGLALSQEVRDELESAEQKITQINQKYQLDED